MKMSAAGRSALIKREGKRNLAYRDSVGVWTIGVGHTAAAGPPSPKAGMRISDAEIDSLLTKDLVQYENAVSKAITKPMSQNEFDAFVSFCYNIGPGGFARSSTVKAFNKGDKAGAAKGFMAWLKPKELYGRRSQEVEQFLTPDKAAAGNPVALQTPISKGWVAKVAGFLGFLPTTAVAAPIVVPDAPADNVVLQVQKRLQELGYNEVGRADGFYGPNTRKAILAFSDENGDDFDGEVSDELLAALVKAHPRAVSLDRATATVGDLKREGSEQARSFTQLGWLGGALFGTGGLGSLDAAGALDSVKSVASNASDTFGTVNSAFSSIASVIGWVTHHWYFFAIAGGLYMIYKVARGLLELVDLFRRNVLSRAA